jgi:hypothetical protein
MAYNAKKRNGCKKVCQRMRDAKDLLRLESDPPDYLVWEPPKLRRIVIVIDFDLGKRVVKFFKMYRTNRIDTYRIIDEEGVTIKAGWANFINKYLMKCFVRVRRTYET